MSLANRLLVSALLTGVLWLCACSGGVVSIQTHHGKLSKIPIPTAGPILVMAPLEVPKSWTGVETYKRAVQVAEAMSQDGWILVAPWEYRFILSGNREKILEKSDVARIVEQFGARKSQIWVLRVSIGESSSSQQTAASKEHETASARQHQRYLNVKLAIEDPRLDQLLTAVFASISQDPFNETADEVDALPGLTDALPALAHSLTDALEDLGATSDAELQPHAQLEPSYISLETYAQEGQQALRDPSNKADDMVMRLAFTFVHYQFFVPDIELDVIEKWFELPPGVKVVKAGQLNQLDIRAGDYLLRAGTVPFDGRHTVDRLVRITPPGGWRIVVKRKGETLVLRPDQR